MFFPFISWSIREVHRSWNASQIFADFYDSWLNNGWRHIGQFRMPFCIMAIAQSLWTLCEHGKIWQPLNASSKQIQHSSCPEFGLHLWFPSSLLSKQTLQTSQWKDLSRCIRQIPHLSQWNGFFSAPVKCLHLKQKYSENLDPQMLQCWLLSFICSSWPQLPHFTCVAWFAFRSSTSHAPESLWQRWHG